jgi:hypothetical protein
MAIDDKKRAAGHDFRRIDCLTAASGDMRKNETGQASWQRFDGS